MSTYRIYFQTGASGSVKVEADDLDQAIDLAYDELPNDVCAQCGGWRQNYSIELGDWQFDEDGYELDGEYIDTRPATP